jgi:hypothetical protein
MLSLGAVGQLPCEADTWIDFSAVPADVSLASKLTFERMGHQAGIQRMRRTLLLIFVTLLLTFFSAPETVDAEEGPAVDSTAVRQAILDCANDYTGFDALADDKERMNPTVQLVPVADSVLAYLGGLAAGEEIWEISYDTLDWEIMYDTTNIWHARLWMRPRDSAFLAARFERYGVVPDSASKWSWISGTKALRIPSFTFQGWVNDKPDISLQDALNGDAMRLRRSAQAVMAWLVQLSRRGAQSRPYWCILDISVPAVQTMGPDTIIMTNYLHVYDATSGRFVQASTVVPR